MQYSRGNLFQFLMSKKYSDPIRLGLSGIINIMIIISVIPSYFLKQKKKNIN